MAYKVMGITAGRKNGNSEILLKEALTVCEEAGADVTMINLRDFHLVDCTGCTSCTKAMSQGKYNGCVLDNKDDKKKIMDAMLAQDAVIFSVPAYDLMPASVYLTFAQRSLSYETSFLETIGAIEHHDRVAGLISVGGSTRSWQSMALEGLQATMFTTDMKVVDMMLATRVPAPGQCLLDEKLMARARKLGEHIMQAVAAPPEERGWLGEEDMGLVPQLPQQRAGAGRDAVGRSALSHRVSGLRRRRHPGKDRGRALEVCHPEGRPAEGPHHRGRPRKASRGDCTDTGRILLRSRKGQARSGEEGGLSEKDL